MDEDQAAQDARVEKLWKALDTRREGQLNLEALKKGLAKINHREGHVQVYSSLQTDNPPALKNADTLLQDILKAVDTSGDGMIQYCGMCIPFTFGTENLSWTEFRTFVEQTERELWRLFKSIDRDHNGQLDKGELMSAFDNAGIILPKAKLDQFFSEVDTNHDGVITFDEWRYEGFSYAAQLP